MKRSLLILMLLLIFSYTKAQTFDTIASFGISSYIGVMTGIDINGTPYLAYNSSSNNNEIVVNKFSQNSWTNLLSSYSYNPDIHDFKISSTGKVYLITDNVNPDIGLSMIEIDGSSVSTQNNITNAQSGYGSFRPLYSRATSLATTATNELYLCVDEDNNITERLSLYKYNGSYWSAISNSVENPNYPLPQHGEIYYDSLDSSVYVFYSGYTFYPTYPSLPYGLFYKKYSSNGWSNIIDYENLSVAYNVNDLCAYDTTSYFITHDTNFSAANNNVLNSVSDIRPNISNINKIESILDNNGVLWSFIKQGNELFVYKDGNSWSLENQLTTNGYQLLDVFYCPNHNSAIIFIWDDNYTIQVLEVSLVATPPVANFNADLVSTCTDIDITFTDASMNAPTSWLWDFGDGQTSTLQNPTHHYSSTGTYSVSLTATNSNGYDQMTKTAYININCQGTKIRTLDCGKTLSTFGQFFYADPVAGASAYEFQFTNTTTSSVVTNIRSNYTDALVYANLAEIGATYDVQVRAKVNGVWGNFGTTCQIHSPAAIPTTELRTLDCGKTLSSFGQFFYANPVTGATAYEFQFTNTTTSSVVTNIRSNYTDALVYANLAEIGATYNVQVRVKVNGVWGNFGTTCQIHSPAAIPTTELRTLDCGKTLSTFGQFFYANPVTGATAYEFKFTNTTTQTTYSNQRSNYTDALVYAGITDLSTTFDVEVRVQVNGTWGSFGPICQITSPATAILVNNNTNEFIDQFATPESKTGINIIDVSTYPNPNDGSEISIEVNGLSTSDNVIEIQIVDLSGRIIHKSIVYTSDEYFFRNIHFDNQLSAGIYLLNVKKGTTITTEKIFVK